MNSIAKKITIICTVILCLLSILSMTFYGIIIFLLPEKIVDDAVYSNTLKNVTDENEQFIINVNYYTNDNNNGVKLFEIKINNYMDTETATSDNPNVYSKGIQFVGDTFVEYSSEESQKSAFWSSTYMSYFVATGKTVCFYDTQNNVSARSTVKLNDDSQFRISIDDDIYLMAFYGTETYKTETGFLGWKKYYEKRYDLSYLVASLYNIANSVDYGSGQITQDFGKLFKFKKFENGSYGAAWLTSETVMNGKLQKNFYNYFTINIHKYKDGATKASDSLFKIINNDANFEIVDKAKADDYFNGEQLIKFSESNFIYMLLDDKTYHAELSKHSRELLDKYPKNQVVVEINRIKLTERGIDVAEFSIDQKYKDRVVINYV